MTAPDAQRRPGLGGGGAVQADGLATNDTAPAQLVINLAGGAQLVIHVEHRHGGVITVPGGAGEQTIEVPATATGPRPVNMRNISELEPPFPSAPAGAPRNRRYLYRVSWRYPTWEPGYWRSRFVTQRGVGLVVDQLRANGAEWKTERSTLPIHELRWESVAIGVTTGDKAVSA